MCVFQVAVQDGLLWRMSEGTAYSVQPRLLGMSPSCSYINVHSWHSAFYTVPYFALFTQPLLYNLKTSHCCSQYIDRSTDIDKNNYNVVTFQQ